MIKERKITKAERVSRMYKRMNGIEAMARGEQVDPSIAEIQGRDWDVVPKMTSVQKRWLAEFLNYLRINR